MSINLPTRRLVNQEDSSMIQSASVPRSKYANAWTRKATYNAGILYPFLIDEILPGDHVRYEITAYIRLATLLFPMFDNQRVDTHVFYVPNRLVWGPGGTPGSWAAFMGQQSGPAQPLPASVPVIELTSAGCEANNLYHHFGIPVGNLSIPPESPFLLNALPFRAYNLIWNEWFRDQNLQDSVSWLGEPIGNDPYTLYVLLPRAKSHDYFTQALPWAQKFTAPTIPLLGDAFIKGLGWRDDARAAYSGPINVRESDNSVEAYAFYREVGGSDEADPRDVMYAEADAAANSRPVIYADLTTATGVTVNQLRQSMQIQVLLERDARGGTRYTEIVKSHFDVNSPDARMQRPEYIGGGSSMLNITPIAQTAPTEDLPVGALGGVGTASGRHTASYASTEHGFIIGLISVRSELSYQQGVNKMFRRRTRFDYYWPALAGLGEQAVLREEIYAIGDPELDATVFGYVPRWDEYRMRTSEVVGEFDSLIGSLDMWHLAQVFETPPTLSPEFIVDNPPMARVLAAGSAADNQQYLADIMIRRNIVRPLPMFGTPVGFGRL